jgi:hypothetical protein
MGAPISSIRQRSRLARHILIGGRGVLSAAGSRSSFLRMVLINMFACRSCGGQNPDSSRFCGSCGASLAVTEPSHDPSPGSSAVPPHGGAAYSAPHAGSSHQAPTDAGGSHERPAARLSMPNIQLERLLTGDWIGAAMTALAVFATAAVLAVALVGLADPANIGVKQFLTAAGLMVAAAFGGDVASGLNDSESEVAVTIGAYPLTLTIAALAVGSMVFWWRVARRRQTLVDGIVHAVRASLILAGLLTVSSLVLRTELSLPEEFGVLGTSDVQGQIGSNLPAAALLGAFYLFLTCAATCLRRRDWLPRPMQRVRDFLVLPTLGIAAVLAVVCVAALVAGIGTIIAVEELQESASFALLLSALPNLGLAMFFVGGGAAAKMSSTGSDSTFDEAQSMHLTALADMSSDWVWLVPLATALALVAAAACVVLYSRSAKEARGGLLRWLLVMTLASPLLVHLAAVHGHAQGTDLGDNFSVDVVAGISVWQAMLLTALWTFVAAVLATGLVPKVFREPSATPWPVAGTGAAYGGQPPLAGQHQTHPPHVGQPYFAPQGWLPPSQDEPGRPQHPGT